MKKIFYLILLICTLTLSSCTTTNTETSYKFIGDTVLNLADKIQHYYYDQEKMYYTVIGKNEAFKTKNDENDEFYVCIKASVKTYDGYVEFIKGFKTSNYFDKNSYDTSVVFNNEVIDGNSSDYEIYKEMKNRPDLEYFDINYLNDILQNELNDYFPNGMVNFGSNESLDNNYEGGDEQLLSFVYSYEDVEDGIKILGYHGELKNHIIIPEQIDGKKVVIIGSEIFNPEEETYIEYIKIPYTVKEVYSINRYKDNFHIDYAIIENPNTKGLEHAFYYSTKILFTNYNTGSTYSNVKNNMIVKDNMLFIQHSDEEATLADVLNSAKNITIPDYITINNKRLLVNKIDGSAFDDCPHLEKIILNNNDIDYNKCTYPSEESAPNLITNNANNGKYLGTKTNPYYLFIGRVSDTTPVILKDSVEHIITDNLKSIDYDKIVNGIAYIKSENTPYFYGAFMRDYKYNNPINYHDDTKFINLDYYRTSGLDINVGQNIKHIFTSTDTYAHFNYIVNPLNQYYTSDSYGVLFDKYKTTLIDASFDGRNNNIKAYTVPESVLYISDNAFGDINFDELHLNNVIELGKGFYETHIKYLSVGNNLRKTGKLFTNASIKYCSISEQNKYLKAQNGFVTNKNGEILYGTYGNLDVYHIPNTVKFVKEIGAKENLYIFPKTIQQMVRINVGHTTKLIIENKDSYCGEINSLVHFGEAKIIDNTYYCINNNEATLVYCNKKDQNLTISDTIDGNIKVTKLGKESIRTSYDTIKLGKYIKIIDVEAMRSSKINTLILNENLERIGYGFIMNSGLKHIVIPANVKQIDTYAFGYMKIEIFLEHTSIPSDFYKEWNENNNYYLKDQWHYENGVPTLNK